MSSNWDASCMPSQRGRIALVTGAAQGLGFECARDLFLHGARVFLADVAEARGRQAIQELRELALTTDGVDAANVEFLHVDMGCMESVKALAETVRTKTDRLDILLNNAGVGVPPQTECTDGYPIQFGVNYLGHFYLTTLLFDLLKQSPAARVVQVSSPAHRQEASAGMCKSTKLDFTKLAKGEGDNGLARYEKSKLCCLIFAYELDRRLKKAGITTIQSIGAQPGICYTNIFDQSIKNFYPRVTWGLVQGICSLVMQTPSMGSLSLLYAATAEDAAGGEFFGPRGWKHWSGYPARETSSPASYSEEYGEGLWALSERLTKTAFDVNK